MSMIKKDVRQLRYRRGWTRQIMMPMPEDLKAGGGWTDRTKERGSEKSGERSVPYGEEPGSGEEHALASDDICDAAEQ